MSVSRMVKSYGFFLKLENFSSINQAIYALKLWLVEQSVLNWDSLLNQLLILRFICTYQIDLSINFRSIHSHSEVIVEFSVVFVTVSAIRVYNDIINFLKKISKSIYKRTCPIIAPVEFESLKAFKTITDLLLMSMSSCKSLVFETPKTIIVPKIRSRAIPKK